MRQAGRLELVGRRGAPNGHGYIPIYRLNFDATSGSQSPEDMQSLQNLNSEDLQGLQNLSVQSAHEVLQFATRSTARIAPDKKNSIKKRTSLVSKSAKEADPRHAEFTTALHDAWQHAKTDVPFSFGAADGKALKSLLADNPRLTVDLFKRCLWNRQRSERVVLTQAPRHYLSRILEYANGPLDRYRGRLEPKPNAGNIALQVRAQEGMNQADEEALSKAEAAASLGMTVEEFEQHLREMTGASSL
jgi:hypothetical protein